MNWRRIALLVILILAVAAAWLLWLRPQRDLALIEQHQAAPATPRPGALTARWYGTTALLLSDGEQALMIDPFFSRPPGVLPMMRNALIEPDAALIKQWLARAGVSHLDAVLVSHSHFDHSMDAGVVARDTGALLLGSESTANVGRGAGLDEAQIRVIQPQQPITVGRYTIRFFESRHAGATGGRPTGDITAPLVPPAHYLDYRLGGAYSILIEHPAGRVLHHGSAGFVEGALRGQHADIVFLGAALIGDLPKYLHETVDAVGAKQVVLTHWDDFTGGLDQPLRPMPLVVNLAPVFGWVERERRDLQMVTPVLDQPIGIRRGVDPADASP
jgi:L-ascorbate metabolism protein UlaG (beta-lactamase superfamily)